MSKQVRHLALGDGGGRLVHDDQAGVIGDRLGDLHHLRLGDAQLFHQRGRD